MRKGKKIMNIILNHGHDVEVQSQLDKANCLARTRTVDIDEVYGAISVLEQKFEDCSKRSMEGLVVHCDLNSQYVLNTCAGVPMSTHFVLMYEKRSWRFVRAECLRCGGSGRYEVVYLPEPMCEELLGDYMSFDR